MIKIKKNKDFIGTLRNILEVYLFLIKNEDYQGIIQLLEEKNGFKILDLEQFKSGILVKHFTHNNYSSFRRQLNLYGFQSHKSNKNEILYTNDTFNFERDKKLKKQRKADIQTENIELEQKRQLNQLLQLQQNQKQMMEQIQTIITTQKELKEKMKSQLSVKIIIDQNYVQKRFVSDQRDKFLFLALSLYTNIEDQNFSTILSLLEQYIDDLISEVNYFPFFNQLKHQLIKNTKILFSLINFYFNREFIDSKSIDNSFNEQDLEDKLSLSNISNYFDF